MRNIVLFALLALILLPAAGVVAQYQSTRFEEEREDLFSSHHVLPAPEGVIVIEDRSVKGAADRQWYIQYLDQGLTKVWEKEMIRPVVYQLTGLKAGPENAWFVFRETGKLVADMKVVQVNYTSGTVTERHLTGTMEFTWGMMEVLDKTLFIAGYVSESPVVLRIPPNDLKPQVIPGYFTQKGRLLALAVNEGEETINVVTQEPRPDGNWLRLRTYDTKGEDLFERFFRLKPQTDMYQLTTHGFVDGNIIVSGFYGSAREYYSTGVLFGVIRPEDQENLLLYHALNDFERIREVATDGGLIGFSKAGNESDDLKSSKSNLLFEISDLKQVNNGFIIVASIYVKSPSLPRRQTNGNRHGYGAGSGPGENPFLRAVHPFLWHFYNQQHEPDLNLPFIPYRNDRLHQVGTLTAGFGSDGNLQWNNFMQTLPQDRQYVGRLTNAFPSEEGVNMVYRHESKLVFSSVPFTSLPVTELQQDLKLQAGDRKVRKTFPGEGGVYPWGDNDFLIWGYQQIRGENGLRNVLYINKLEFSK